MTETTNTNDFDAAVAALFSPLHQSVTRQAIQAAAARRTRTVSDMRTYLQRINMDLNCWTRQKRLIHITGTKGKGSTACLCETILRQVYGLRTGLFTSPHLVDIRERIRIHGKPVSRSVFGQAYWQVRRRLEAFPDEKDIGGLPQLPGYFRMLTLMALYIFAHYDPLVDVIILEVGMGGRYDATNVIDLDCWQSFACGITLLDLDHTRVLGSLLEQIAWEKGGIFQIHKGTTTTPRPETENVVYENNHNTTFTTDKRRFFALDCNKDSALQVLRQCAHTEGEGQELVLVGEASAQIPPNCSIGLPGNHQRVNAELAVALCKAVMEGTIVRNEDIFQALGTASWPGRCQTVETNTQMLYLDGAHTVDSLCAGVAWFQQVAKRENQKSLLFNCSHERNPVDLLQLLVPLQFESVYFCRADSERPSAVPKKKAAELLQEMGKDAIRVDKTDTTWQDTLALIWKYLEDELGVDEIASARANLTVSEALSFLSQRDLPENASQDVFVTGSLYLVGSALTAVGWKEPEADGRIKL